MFPKGTMDNNTALIQIMRLMTDNQINEAISNYLKQRYSRLLTYICVIRYRWVDELDYRRNPSLWILTMVFNLIATITLLVILSRTLSLNTADLALVIYKATICPLETNNLITPCFIEYDSPQLLRLGYPMGHFLWPLFIVEYYATAKWYRISLCYVNSRPPPNLSF